MKIIILGAGQVGGTLAENLVGENLDLIINGLENLRFIAVLNIFIFSFLFN